MRRNAERIFGDDVCGKPFKNTFKTLFSFCKHFQKLMIKHCNRVSNMPVIAGRLVTILIAKRNRVRKQLITALKKESNLNIFSLKKEQK